MRICQVESRRDLRDFIKLPYELYGKDKVWIPPLRGEQEKQFSQKTNPFLEHCHRRLFLLKDKGKVIGRIAAFIDDLAMDFWKERIGHFGYFECIQNEKASKILFKRLSLIFLYFNLRTVD